MSHEQESKRLKHDLSFEDEHVEPPAFSLATLGLQRVGTVPPPKPQPQQPIQMLNARGMPARIRKKNRLFFDDDIINDDKPLRMSLSPRKLATAKLKKPLPKLIPAAILSLPPSSHTRGKTSPLKSLSDRKRKGVNSKYMRLNEKRLIKKPEPITPKSKNKETKIKLNSSSKSSAHAIEKASTQTVNESSEAITSAPVNANQLELPASSNTNPSLGLADKQIGHTIGLRLRNVLKLPKAHRFVIFEWFYSFIDRQLFEGENDFQACLNDMYPTIETRQMSRPEWRHVRQRIGKPRRCSEAFFAEERRELQRKRQKIRFIQTRKSGDLKDINFIRDLPDKIPLALPIGTKVTARLRTPQDGIFTGIIEAYDSLESSYRVHFDRSGLGTHTIQDIEIVSDNFFEMFPLQSLTKNYRPVALNHQNHNVQAPSNALHDLLSSNLNRSDPLLGQKLVQTPLITGTGKKINGYPIQLLEMVMRLKRALEMKRMKLRRLTELNSEAELTLSRTYVPKAKLFNESDNESEDDDTQHHNDFYNIDDKISSEFQRRYTSIVLCMVKMNNDMEDYLSEIQHHVIVMTRDPQIQAMMTPTYLREKCKEAADLCVKRNLPAEQQLSERSMQLIQHLSTILFVSTHLNNPSAQILNVLEGCMEEVKSFIDPENYYVFQKNVQQHLHRIHSGVTQIQQEDDYHRQTETETEADADADAEAEPDGEMDADGDSAEIDEKVNVLPVIIKDEDTEEDDEVDVKPIDENVKTEDMVKLEVDELNSPIKE